MATLISGVEFSLDFRDCDISMYAFMHFTTARPGYFAGDYRDFGLPEYLSEFFGSGFIYDTSGEPVRGTITAFQDSFAGALIDRLEGIAVSVPQFMDWIASGDTEAAYATMLAGNDRIVGSPFDDYVRGYAGSDTCLMGDGDDVVINQDPGDDVVDGGPGFDIVWLNGRLAEFQVVVWQGQAGAVPLTPAALAADGVDKTVAVEQLVFAGAMQSYDVGADNFSPLNYLATYRDLADAFGPAAAAGFDHYIYRGVFEGRSVGFSGYEYLASYSDLEAAFGLNPDAAAGHYITTGRFEGRAVLFDGLEYIASYRDLVAAFGADDDAGARHYLSDGRSEGRTTSFDGLEYVASYDDLLAAFGVNRDAGSRHFIEHGSAEGRAVGFDGLEYIASYGDLIGALGPDRDTGSAHYIGHGAGEGRARDLFDAAQYLANYADLQAAFGDDLVAATTHFITNGYGEGRTDDAPPVTQTVFGGAEQLMAGTAAGDFLF
jgi:serralysin